MRNGVLIRLILEDGSEYAGKSFGSKRSAAGEVVFNTAMTGYPENLTDPSYRGQILVSTYPLIGNYGVPDAELEGGLPRHFESDSIHVAGLVIAEYSDEYSHWNSSRSLGAWLTEHRVPGISGIDTRALTRRLRERGTLRGKIVYGDDDIEFGDPARRHLVAEVSAPEVRTFGHGRFRVVLVDCGVKANILRCLLARDTTVTRVPWDYDFTTLEADGILISNGPGDPKACAPTIAHVRQALEKVTPIFGICLGNQLLALAAGADTYKLKYGHRSHNQPVAMAGTARCFITAQNHGYATDITTLPDSWELLFTNVNDGTNEGIRHRTKPFFSSQFHPEASGGPTDTEFLFDDFIALMEAHAR
jgi:carbamoyl-phosphate synthase small subunit